MFRYKNALGATISLLVALATTGAARAEAVEVFPSVKVTKHTYDAPRNEQNGQTCLAEGASLREFVKTSTWIRYCKEEILSSAGRWCLANRQLVVLKCSLRGEKAVAGHAHLRHQSRRDNIGGPEPDCISSILRRAHLFVRLYRRLYFLYTVRHVRTVTCRMEDDRKCM